MSWKEGCILLTAAMMVCLAGCKSCGDFAVGDYSAGQEFEAVTEKASLFSKDKNETSAEQKVSAENEMKRTESSSEQESYFEAHFIDVGQADAALVLCDGEAMLIDGGNAADSDLIYSYLRYRSLNHLRYIVCTHAEEDHVGGLAGALNYAAADTVFCPVTSANGRAFGSFRNYLEKQGLSITVPSAGDVFMLGSAEVQVLGPINMDSSEPNNTSIVLRVVYGETSFLFTGDAEKEEEEDIIAAGYTLDSDVLKVGHHGGASSTTELFLQSVRPLYAVVSVGAGNPYGHPARETLSRLSDAGVKLYRTDMQGDIICTSDGKSLQFSAERNADADTMEFAAEEPSQEEIAKTNAALDSADYVLNKNTKVFHYLSCSSVKQMNDKNKVYYTGTRDEVIELGYNPCGKCHP